MTGPGEAAFTAWAPDESPWSLWAKPVLFVGLGSASPTTTMPPAQAVDVSRFPEPRDRMAIVIDLPGRAGADLGLALARIGYRPVPLYNCCSSASAVVDVAPIEQVLRAGAEELPHLRIRDDAPPVFLLDANRMQGPAPLPGRFDNRWLVFPQDFPSASYLRSRGIGRVLLVQEKEAAPREDLAHVLRRWQLGGIELMAATPAGADHPRPLQVAAPSLFRRAWYRVAATMGLRRSNVGGFGAIVPIPTATG